MSILQLELLAYIRKLNEDPTNDFVSEDMTIWDELGITTTEELDAFIVPMPYFAQNTGA